MKGQVALLDIGEAQAAPKAKRVRKAVVRTDEERLRGEVHARIMAVYDREFLAAREVRPIIGAAEGTAVKRLLDTLKGDEARATRIITFVYRSEFWRTRGAITIRTIAADPSRFERGQHRDQSSVSRFAQSACENPTSHETFEDT